MPFVFLFFFQRCEVLAQQQDVMKCKSPRIAHELISFESGQPIALEYGLIMDNVTEVRNLSSKPGFKKFQLFPNPVYEPFNEEDGIKYYKNDYLTINVNVYLPIGFTLLFVLTTVNLFVSLAHKTRARI